MNKIYIPIIIINLFLTGCATKSLVQIPNYPPQKITLTVTGYCECKICCGWKRNWRFQPVYAYGPSVGKSKKKRVMRDTEADKQKRIEESDKRMRDKEEKKQEDPQEKKEETVTVEAAIPIDFQGIDSKNQEYLKHIIPQLNAIYKAVTQKDIDEQTGENEVKITREGFDDENTIIEASTTVYVPKYIPPIKIE